MHEMGWYGDIDGISRLLDEGVDPAAPEECMVRRGLCVRLSWLALQGGSTALLRAAVKCRMSVVRLLVERASHLLEARNWVSGIVVFARWLTVGRMDSYQHTKLLRKAMSPSSRCCVRTPRPPWRQRTTCVLCVMLCVPHGSVGVTVWKHATPLCEYESLCYREVDH